MRVIPDIIQGAGIKVMGEYAVIYRAFLVLEIDDGFAGPVDSNALILASQNQGVPRIGDEHPNESTAFCIGHEFEPISGLACRIVAAYRTDYVIDFSGQSQVVLEDDIQLASTQTQLLPKTKEPIRVQYKNPLDANDFIPPKSAFVSLMTPTRVLTVRGHTLGRPPNFVYDLIGSVNGADFFGMGAGYWLFTGMRNRSTNRGKSYSVQLQFMSKMIEDWSTYVVSQLPDGQFLVAKKAVTDAFVARAYAFGVFPGYDHGVATSFVDVVNPAGDNTTPAGITKVGPYEAKSWAAFQFDDSFSAPELGGST